MLNQPIGIDLTLNLVFIAINQLRQRQPKNVSDLSELGHIEHDAPFLETAHKRGWLIQLARKFALQQPLFLA